MSSIKFRLDIQGLRAIAVLTVLVFHFNSSWLPGGFIGVDVFFVISGFLITSILLYKKSLPDHNLKRTIYQFYTSRIKRIAPAYYVLIILVALTAAILYPQSDLSSLKGSLVSSSIFNSNSFFATFGDYFAPANHEQPLLHTWSLAVEIQFYLLAPLIILFIPKRFLGLLLTFLVLVLTIVAEYKIRVLGLNQVTYYSLYARLPEFFIGGLAALYLSNNPPINNRLVQFLGFIAIVVSAIFQPKLGPFPGFSALIPTIGVGLILITQPLTIYNGSLITRFLSSKTMVWIGSLSYSLYLWHWPVLAFIRYHTDLEYLSIEYAIIFISLTMALSLLSYYWIEEGIRKKLSNKSAWLALGLIIGALVGTGLFLKKINNFVTPVAVEYTRYADPNEICHSKIIGNCLKGDLRSQKEVLVIGDSHAAMLNHFFDELGREQKFKARIITSSSCVTIPSFDYKRISESHHKNCINQIKEVKKYTKNADEIYIAAYWSSHLQHSQFKKALQSFLIENGNQDTKIYLIAQVPLLEKNPQRVFRFSSTNENFTLPIDQSYRKANSELALLAEQNRYIEYLDFESTGFFKEAPFYKNQLIYLDKHHINEFGAKEYAKASSKVFENK